MKISIIGTGYVGLVTGVGLADAGHNVVCVDIDEEKIEKISRGISPIYEKDLEKLLKKNNYHVVAVKSTVAPETTEKVVLPLLEKYSGKKAGKNFGLCMNPEFLKEGDAV